MVAWGFVVEVGFMAFDLWDYATAKTPAERGIALALFTADVGALLLDCTDGGAGVGVLALAGTRATIKAGRTGAKLASAARHAGNAALHAGNEGRKQQGGTSDSKADAGGANSGSSAASSGDAGTTAESAQKTRQASETEAKFADQSQSGTAKGGTYKLKDRETGSVRRTGKTNDLDRREREHARGEATKDLDFEVDRRSDNEAARRGREQRIYDEHPEADLNKRRPISPQNPKRDQYLEEGDKL